jgi:hypothetical protein
MTGGLGIIALLIVLALSLIITRMATVALTLTGLSEEIARFQARSAFTGTGFTTREAENVVNHPVRRRIIMLLMVLRSAGLVTIVLSFILSFLGSADDTTRLIRIIWLAGGVIVLWIASSNRVLDRYMRRFIEWTLRRWTKLDVTDYASLLRLSGDYTVVEALIKPEDWLANKRLENCHLPREGITILGITRDDGTYIGVPRGATEIQPGDTLILYGRAQALSELDKRLAGSQGDEAHERAVAEQQRRIDQQELVDREHRRKTVE